MILQPKGVITVKCKVCGKEFKKFTRVRGGRKQRGIRQSNTVNCSKECTRKYLIRLNTK